MYHLGVHTFAHDVLTSVDKRTYSDTSFYTYTPTHSYKYSHTHSLYTQVNTGSHKHTSWTKWEIHSPPLIPNTEAHSCSSHTLSYIPITHILVLTLPQVSTRCFIPLQGAKEIKPDLSTGEFM